MKTAPNTDAPTLAIVGPGRVGRSLARAAGQAGVPVALLGRERDPNALAAAEIVLICVADRQIAAVADELAGQLRADALVGHTSGATGRQALERVGLGCAGTFILHPLQTIPGPETELGGVPCAISVAEPELARPLLELARELGMEPFTIDEAGRAAYHAAAVMASNFLFGLEDSAARLLETAGVDCARERLTPLVLRSAANWAEHGAAALTGPIARGDEQTTEAHIEAIRELAPELLPLYEALAARTREIAAARTPTA